MTINFNDEDIKNAKIGLANQTLTSLQSAFLMQYIINLEQKEVNLIKYLEDKIKDCEYQIDIVGNYQKICERRAYIDILERVKSGKYDKDINN